MSEVKYFETTITPPFKKGEQVVVYCKAVWTGKDWTVCICHTDSSTPFIIIQNGVDEKFFKGSEQITKSFYHQMVSFVGNLVS